MSGWVYGISTAVSVGAKMIAANQAKKAAQGNLNASLAANLDPATVGANSLNAQGGLAGQAIDLNTKWGPQFANSNNMGLFSSLFGQGAMSGLGASQLQNNPNWSKFSPEVQNYLLNQGGGMAGAGAAGAGAGATGAAGMGPAQYPGATGSSMAGNGKSQYENLLSMYQGMGGKLGTPEDAEAFNKWTTDQGFGGWHENNNDPNNPAASLGGALDTANGGVNAPGVLDMMVGADQVLNPNYKASLDALGAAAGKAPTKIGYNNVANSPYGDSLAAFMRDGTAPQVNGPGANQGMQHLQNLLASSGYQGIQGANAAGMTNVNLAGNAALSAGPQAGPAQQGVQGSSGMALSAGPNQINAPTSFNQVTGQNVTGPNGFERVGGPAGYDRVNGPSPFANVTANTDNVNITVPDGFERVGAPQVGLQSVSAGQNKLLTDLTNSGFNANRPIQQMLEGQAQSDLALGGQLSADQTRMAQQAARAAAESRGMAGSNGSMLNEVQRQLDMSRQLQNERRGFAASTEAAGFGQIRDQQDQAIKAADVTNNYLGIDVGAQQSNNTNALAQGDLTLRAGLANQQAGLEGNRLNLQGQIANQNARTQANQLNLDAQRANQQAGLTNSDMALRAQLGNQQAGLTNSDMALRANLANQNAGLDLSRLGLQANMANQSTNLAAQQANQNAGLDLSRMGLAAQTSNAANAMNNNQFNAGNTIQNNQFNAQQGQQNSQFNAQQNNALAQLMAQLGMNNNQFNATQTNSRDQFNAGQNDNAASRFNNMAQFNAQQNQQANIANQNTFAQNYANQLGAAGNLGSMYNTMAGQNIDAQTANQQAWMNQRGQTMNGLQALMNSGNDMAQYNASNQLGADRFNAGQDQLSFDNMAKYQNAVNNGRIDPMAAMGFANGQQNWGMFNPWDPAIMSMYANNATNTANANISYNNSKAATNIGLINGISKIGVGALDAYSAGKGGG